MRSFLQPFSAGSTRVPTPRTAPESKARKWAGSWQGGRGGCQGRPGRLPLRLPALLGSGPVLPSPVSSRAHACLAGSGWSPHGQDKGGPGGRWNRARDDGQGRGRRFSASRHAVDGHALAMVPRNAHRDPVRSKPGLLGLDLLGQGLRRLDSLWLDLVRDLVPTQHLPPT